MPPLTESFESSFKSWAVQEAQSQGSAARMGSSEPLAQLEPPFCPFLSPLQMFFFFLLKLLILNKTIMNGP